MNIQHSCRTDSWYTPEYLIKSCRKVLKVINFDPASDGFGNLIVKADRYMTKEDNALTQIWPKNTCIFLNPPGGKQKLKSLPSLFWAKLMNSKPFKHAIFMGFSVEQLAVSQTYHQDKMLYYPFCVPRSRVKFVNPLRKDKDRPSHANVIVYVPGTINKTIEFTKEFSQYGVVHPGVK